MTPAASASIDPEEVAKFDKLAAAWWNPKGPFAPLHVLNPARLQFMRDRAIAHFGRNAGRRPLEGLSAVDIGCGGGLVAEPLARLGADVTAIDGAPDAIAAAKRHGEAVGLSIRYEVASAEELVGRGERFDLVLALEIVEHVADLSAFCKAVGALLAPGGLLIVSTINRTLRARLLAIEVAERVLGWAEPGTHDFDKLVKPEELAAALAPLKVEGPFGLIFDPLQRRWMLGADASVNYFMTATRG